jgi:hypothetical protein
MRFKALQDISRPAPRQVRLTALPEQVLMTDYARAKASLVSELVRQVHGGPYEWYGFTLAEKGRPEVIWDVGLPENAENQETLTRLAPEHIALYQESLPAGLIINGWLHSHGAMAYRHFSPTDDMNQQTVLDYVTALLMAPVAQKEVVIRDLALRVLDGKGNFGPGSAALPLEEAFPAAPASVTLFTDVPVGRARLMETVYGGFSFAIVIGDDGWSRQEIHHKTRGILTGETAVSHLDADLAVVETGRLLTPLDRDTLEEEVRERLRPVAYTLEKLERG